MKQILLLIPVTLSLLTSCQKEKQETAVLPKPETAIEMRPLLLTSFAEAEIPTEIDGCSCFLSTDSLDYKNNRYLYAGDLQESAFMMVNGTMVKFSRSSYTEKDSLNSVSTYKAENIKLTIESTTTKQTDYESRQEEGTITVERSDGQAITKTFFGECGC
jgi:uncharacterized Rmd1/YagE family protein